MKTVVPLKTVLENLFCQHQLPSDLRTGKITAVFKKSDKADLGNYRPVNLTSVVHKILEILIRDEIPNHKKAHKLQQ